jgi:hypothetical protein
MTTQDRAAGDAWTLADLRRANEKRQAEWCPDPSQQPDLAFRAVELAGETGEACNIAKKLVRERHGWRGSRATPQDLGEELADIVICADLTAMAERIDLMAAVRAKFNATTEKVGLTTMLSAAPARSTPPEAVHYKDTFSDTIGSAVPATGEARKALTAEERYAIAAVKIWRERHGFDPDEMPGAEISAVLAIIDRLTPDSQETK